MFCMVSQRAPDFKASAVMADGKIVSDFTLSEHIKGKKAVLFFYPLDFTFVCPSELIALNNAIEKFKAVNTEVIGISIDSQHTHAAWRRTEVSKGGIGPVNFPLVADLQHQICRAYGVEHPSEGVALRATFVIDEQGIIKCMNVNDLPIGRSINEILRQIDAVDFHAQHGDVCPINWEKGKAGMKADSEGVAAYLEEHAEAL